MLLNSFIELEPYCFLISFLFMLCIFHCFRLPLTASLQDLLNSALSCCAMLTALLARMYRWPIFRQLNVREEVSFNMYKLFFVVKLDV